MAISQIINLIKSHWLNARFADYQSGGIACNIPLVNAAAVRFGNLSAVLGTISHEKEVLIPYGRYT
jgi:hypothetical protein